MISSQTADVIVVALLCIYCLAAGLLLGFFFTGVLAQNRQRRDYVKYDPYNPETWKGERHD